MITSSITREGLGEFETVMQTLDFVSELSSILSTPRVFRSGHANTGKNAFYCFNFHCKKANLFVTVKEIKGEILTSREVLYTKSCVRVISSFLPKDAFQNTDFPHLKCQLKPKKFGKACL